MDLKQKDELYRSVYRAVTLKSGEAAAAAANAVVKIVSEAEAKDLSVIVGQDIVAKAAEEVFIQLTAEAAENPTPERFALASAAAEVYIVAQAVSER